MVTVQQYLLSVVAAAIIAGILNVLIGKKSATASVIKLLTGLFLAITVISPLKKIQLYDLKSFYGDLSSDASAFVAQGENAAYKANSSIIKEQLEAYILDKALSMQMDITVSVALSEGLPPVPENITIEGDVSPYGKKNFSKFLTEEIGIPEEKQLWK